MNLLDFLIGKPEKLRKKEPVIYEKEERSTRTGIWGKGDQPRKRFGENGEVEVLQTTGEKVWVYWQWTDGTIGGRFCSTLPFSPEKAIDFEKRLRDKYGERISTWREPA